MDWHNLSLENRDAADDNLTRTECSAELLAADYLVSCRRATK